MAIENASGADTLTFGVIVGLRLLVPLAIPRYPLPGILAAFLLDAVDKSIFQRFTNLNLDFLAIGSSTSSYHRALSASNSNPVAQ